MNTNQIGALTDASAISGSVAEKCFRYQNPISEGIDPHGVRDCQVFRDGERWYMVPTAWPHWPSQETFGLYNPGVVLYSSDNLLQWSFEKVILPPGGADKWYHRRFWAPEIHQLAGHYYLTFNASHPELGYHGQYTGFAVADALLGPYRVVTAEQPLDEGNDLSLFADSDGKVWAFWNRARDFGIGCAEVDLRTGRLLTEKLTALVAGDIEYEADAQGATVMEPDYDGRPRPKVAKCAAWDSIGMEGSFVIKRHHTYYLFYSSWTRGYEIGYATAPSITGPWAKAPENPIFGGQNEAVCQRNGLPYSGDPDSPFDHVGHNSRNWILDSLQ